MPELRKGLHFRSIDAAGPGSTAGGVEAVQFKEMNRCVPPATSRPKGPDKQGGGPRWWPFICVLLPRPRHKIECAFGLKAYRVHGSGTRAQAYNHHARGISNWEADKHVGTQEIADRKSTDIYR